MNRETFESKYIPVTESGCWIWMGACTDRPYGIVWAPRPSRKAIMAHRFSYKLYKGTIPDGMNVCHSCDVTLCVNPKHLFIGTQLDNIHDMIAKKRNFMFPNPGNRGHHAKGSRNGASVITEESVIFMRKLFDDKECSNIAELSRRFHISESQSSRIVYRESWKHI